ncbi:MAG: 50S ribosomal protein L24 [Pirellulaceae bacterium]|jgi:large subunit ribosomal protein L24|nr:50S ribosomal protein L24 [Pirellulaceae bacterium]|tara:strand:+ start:831 stop:1181 length:351 start_codon:yes stop_codon:yes gene_type:complete
MKIQVDDLVRVIAGDDRGQEGKVLKVDHKNHKLVVEMVNRVYKHVRRSQKNPQGGRLSKEMPVDVSNVKLITAPGSEATRLGLRFNAAGNKERYAKVGKSSLGEISSDKRKQSTDS